MIHPEWLKSSRKYYAYLMKEKQVTRGNLMTKKHVTAGQLPTRNVSNLFRSVEFMRRLLNVRF